MRNCKQLYVVGVLALSCASLALLGRSSFSQTSVTKRSELGRYQLVSHSTGTSGQVILVDTQTGRMWAKTAVWSPSKKTYEDKWVEDGPFSGKSTSR
jgi:hypothetical protein